MAVRSRYNDLKKLRYYRPQWDVMNLKGSDACLHWNVRDLQTLEEALKHARGNRCAVQAGSNLGLFPKRLAESFSVVHTFEPDPKLSAQARHNAPEANVLHWLAAIGNSRDSVKLGYGRRDGSSRPNHEGLTHVVGTGGDTMQVVLDDMMLEDLDFMYLDIEGYELFALQGAEKTIERCRPTIVVEINNTLTHYGLNGDQVRNWFADHNYVRQFRIHSDELYVPSETL